MADQSSHEPPSPTLLQLPHEIQSLVAEHTLRLRDKTLSRLRLVCRQFATIGAKAFADTVLRGNPSPITLTYNLSDHSLDIMEAVLRNQVYCPYVTGISFCFDATEGDTPGHFREPTKEIETRADAEAASKASRHLHLECMTRRHKYKLTKALSMASNLQCVFATLEGSIITYASALRPRWPGFIELVRIATGGVRAGKVALHMDAFDPMPFYDNAYLVESATLALAQIQDLSISITFKELSDQDECIWEVLLLSLGGTLKTLKLTGTDDQSLMMIDRDVPEPGVTSFLNFPHLTKLDLSDIQIHKDLVMVFLDTSRVSLREVSLRSIDRDWPKGQWRQVLEFMKDELQLAIALVTFHKDAMLKCTEFDVFCKDFGFRDENGILDNVIPDVGNYVLTTFDKAAQRALASEKIQQIRCQDAELIQWAETHIAGFYYDKHGKVMDTETRVDLMFSRGMSRLASLPMMNRFPRFDITSS